MTDTEHIARAIDQRLVDVRREIASLEAARAAMTSGPALTAAPVHRPRRRRARSRAARPVSTTTLEQLLQGADGATSAALTAQAGGDRVRVLALLRELEAAERVRRSGQRRSTRWHLITDEDRVTVQTAQPAKQTRARAS